MDSLANPWLDNATGMEIVKQTPSSPKRTALLLLSISCKQAIPVKIALSLGMLGASLDARFPFIYPQHFFTELDLFPPVVFFADFLIEEH